MPVREYDPGFELFELEEFLEDDFIIVTDIDVDGLSAANVVLEYYPDATVVCPPPSARGISSTFHIEKLLQKYPGRNILALDQGTNEIKTEALISEMGSKLFVVDHHSVHSPVKNLINPWADDNTEFKELCASSLIYLLMESIHGYNKQAISYAAIGTIADVVPVFKDNRYVIKNGLDEIRNARSGKLYEFLKSIGAYVTSERDISFSVSPMLNSPRRLGMHEVAVGAYIRNDIVNMSELSDINAERKEIVKSALEDCVVRLSDDVVVGLYDESAGISGLVASSLASQYQLVGMAISETGAGSIRSKIEGVSDYILFSKHVTGGGHAHAGGFKINEGSTPDDVTEEFAEFFRGKAVVVRKSKADLTLEFEEALEASFDLESLAPYGHGFKDPVYRSLVNLEDNGSTKSGYKSVLVNGTKGMIWTKEEVDIPEESVIIDYEIKNNRFRGKIYPFVTVVEIN